MTIDPRAGAEDAERSWREFLTSARPARMADGDYYRAGFAAGVAHATTPAEPSATEGAPDSFKYGVCWICGNPSQFGLAVGDPPRYRWYCPVHWESRN